MRDTRREQRLRLKSVNDRRSDGYWKDIENVKREVHSIIQQYGITTLPNKDWLRKKGHSTLPYAIRRYHGGFHQFRKRLGQEQRKTKDGTWMDVDYTIQQAQKIMQDHNFKQLPSRKWLREHGYSSFNYAIDENHGGYRAFRQQLRQQQVKTKDGTWKNLDYTIQQAQQIMRDHEFTTVPDHNWLRENGYGKLSYAISKYYGGFPAFRKRLHQHLGTKNETESLEELLTDYAT